MDFSGFNGPEQAHMTKMIEKKQVSASLHASLRLEFQRIRLYSDGSTSVICSKQIG
jgi:hypothetical protein